MALQVWLPLNGNLNNQGLSNVTVTNNGATVDNNGKIGKCYSFNGSSNYIQITMPSTMTTILNTTVAAWVKSTGSVVALGGISNDGDYRNAMVTLYTSGWQFAGGTGYKYISGGSIANSGVWHHVACTVTDTTITTYLDGAQVATNTLSALGITVTNITSANFIEIGCDHPGGNEFLTGCVNDFRIYDHALSPKEVEVLSKGLVCHYPLSGNGRSGDNLLLHTNPSTYGVGYLQSYANGTVTVDSSTTFQGRPTIKVTPSSSTTSSGGANTYNTSVNLTNGKQYCYSCWIKSTVADTWSFNSLGHFQTNTASASHNRTIQHEGDNIPANTWTQVYITFTPTADCKFYSYHIYFANTSQTIWIANVKLEEGDHPTSWMPNSADSEYSAMGYDSTTEFDCSGYQNNMTKTGTITYTSDSARYSVASHFVNGSYLMANQNCTEYLPTDGLTVNLWIKATTWGTPISCTEGGGWNIESYNNGLQFQCMIANGVGYKPAWCNVTAASITDNKWHMLTGTFDRTAQQTKIYIDGVLKGTGNTGSTYGIGYVANRLIISGEAQSTTPASSTFVGEESDVRIYATALSAAQVAELYNTAVSVANNGTLMGYELVEG